MTEQLDAVVLHCPECDWSAKFDPRDGYEREARKIDAGHHYVESHGGQIPDDVKFGQHQCPECYDILGLDGTASCSECGYILPRSRA